MIESTEYDAASGRLGMLLAFSDEATQALNQRPGYGYLEGHWIGDHYYVTEGQATARPTQSTTLDGLTLSGLPAPCTLWIDSTSYPVTDSTATLDLPIAGTYRLRVEAFPYLDWTGSVTV